MGKPIPRKGGKCEKQGAANKTNCQENLANQTGKKVKNGI